MSLKEQITKQPDGKYVVVVVSKSNIDLGKFDLASINGSENLSKDKLSGYQILALEKLKN